MQLEKEEKGTNLSAEYGVSKWQISDIRKSKEKIMMFANTCTSIHNGQLRCRPYCFPNNLQMFCFTIKCRLVPTSPDNQGSTV